MPFIKGRYGLLSVAINKVRRRIFEIIFNITKKDPRVTASKREDKRSLEIIAKYKWKVEKSVECVGLVQNFNYLNAGKLCE